MRFLLAMRLDSYLNFEQKSTCARGRHIDRLGPRRHAGPVRRPESNHRLSHEGSATVMNVIVDLCVVPVGVGVSLSAYVAACERVLKEAGLEIRLHAYGTNVEGEWDAVFAAVKKCHEVVHAMGAPRISTTIKLGTRTDRSQTMEERVRSVESKS
jgi:uncharacterized protein (TIGR00106 family)